MTTSTTVSTPTLFLYIGVSLLFMALAGFYGVFMLEQLSIESPLTLTQFPLTKVLLGWLVVLVTDIIVAWGLYQWLRVTQPKMALVMAILRLIYAGILAYALSFLWELGWEWKGHSSSVLLATVVQEACQLFQRTWSLGLILFGGHLISLGYLCGRQTEVPKVWSVLLIVAGIGYVILHTGPLVWSSFDRYQSFLEIVFIPAMILGELGLAIWLLLQRKQLLRSSCDSFSNPTH